MNNLFKGLLLLSLIFSASKAFSYDSDIDFELTHGKILAAQVMEMDHEIDELESVLSSKLNDLASTTDDLMEGKIIAAQANMIDNMIEKLRSDLDLIDLYDDFSVFEQKLEKIKNAIHNL
jgi:hypothetical protein